MTDSMAIGFDGFQEAVAALWPTYRTNVQPMWDTTVYRFAMAEVREALLKHRGANPDMPKPIWNLIYADLICERHRRDARTAEAGREREREVEQIRLRLVDEIIAEHTEAECEAAWRKYVATMETSKQKWFINMRRAMKGALAELLAPGRIAERLALLDGT